MDKFISFLRDWTKHYINHRNIFLKTLERIDENLDGYELIAIHKDKEVYYSIKPFIVSFNGLFELITNEKNFCIITFNCIDNLKLTVANWDKLIEYDKLCIIFVNPFSKLDKKWIIFPHTHNKISERESLEAGLKTMFETVDPIDKEEAEKKIN